MDPRIHGYHNASVEEEKEEEAVGPDALLPQTVPGVRPSFAFGGNPARVLTTPVATAASTSTSTSTTTSTQLQLQIPWTRATRAT